MSHKVAQDEYKVFNDCVHGHIKLHPLCVSIMDTPEFQRLRNLKQVGPVYFVYPGGSHNRFEHCLGVCYLAGQMVDALRKNTITEEMDDTLAKSNTPLISDDEKLAIEVAALCHDLGHGPYSHTWERFLEKTGKKWKHEDSSIELLKYLIEKNRLKGEIEKYLKRKNVDEFIAFIGNIIRGDDENDRDGNKFLFQIVSNKSNGIDVDRWDYILRDGHQLNITFSFNYNRLLEFCRIVNVNGSYVICFRKKEAQNIYDMFLARANLHKKAYHHHVVEVIEEMLIDALYAANNAGFRIKGKLLSEADEDLNVFSELTDHVLYSILSSEEPEFEEARTLLRRILSRDLYQLITCINFSSQFAKDVSEVLYESADKFKIYAKEQERKYKEQVRSEIRSALQGMDVLSEDKFIVKMNKLDLGSEMKDALGKPGKKINPFTNVYFYDKHSTGAEEIDWMEIPIFQIPEEGMYRIVVLVMYRNKARGDVDYQAEQHHLREVKRILDSK